MINGTEQFVAAQRALLDTVHNVSLKGIEGAAKLFELNAQAARSVLAESTGQMKSLFDLDATKLADKGLTLSQPFTDKATAYIKQAYEIVTATNSQIAELLQKHVEEAQEFAVEAIDNAARSAPAGSETVFAAAKNSFGAVRTAYEQAVNASKKLTQLTEQNVAAVAKAGGRVAKQASDEANQSPIVAAAA